MAVIRTVEAGALVRRQFRAMLDAAGLRWTEHRGWLSSSFVISGSRADWGALHDVADEIIAAHERGAAAG
jgi:hypothetical protein